MSNQNRRKAVAFFLFESRELFTYPTITNAAVLLSRAGFAVDIYLPEHMLCESPAPDVRLIVVSRNDSRIYIQSAIHAASNRRNRYDVYFAAYFEGLAVATLLQKSGAVPVVYLSMELIYRRYAEILRAELNGWTIYGTLVALARFVEATEVVWKHLPDPIPQNARRLRDSQGIVRIRTARYHLRVLPEVLRFARESVVFSVVQDEHREAVLRREFDFVQDVIRVPNSYIGLEERPSDFALERFGILPERRILLYSGAVERGFGGNFFNFLHDLDDERYVLIANVYSRDGYIGELRPALADLIRDGRLILNEKLLSEQEYERLVRSSHICLAWYGTPEPGDDNMYYLGLSSGKMNRYLACGKPVIVPDYYHGYSELMETSGIGVACASVSNIPAAIREIDRNYAVIQENVREFYLSRLEFARQFRPLIERLETITSDSAAAE